MALIRCKECGKEISNTSKVCVHCGAKTELAKKKNENMKILLIAVGVIAILAIVYILINNFYETDAEKQMRETEDFRNSIQDSYNTMLENNKKYKK